jgi:hypothetical protein
VHVVPRFMDSYHEFCIDNMELKVQGEQITKDCMVIVIVEL